LVFDQNFIRVIYIEKIINLILSNFFNFNKINKNSTAFHFKKNANHLNLNATSIIEAFFNPLSCFISKPTFHESNSKITIKLFYFIPNSEKLDKSNISALNSILSQLFEKNISIILIRIHYPYLNSYIFAQFLAHNAPSYSFFHFQDAIFSYPSLHYTSLPAHLHGIKIQLSGRLETEQIIPRVTVKSTIIGSFKKNKNTFIDYSKFTTKNDLGTFTIKI
jgi:hypothetical protein